MSKTVSILIGLALTTAVGGVVYWEANEKRDRYERNTAMPIVATTSTI